MFLSRFVRPSVAEQQFQAEPGPGIDATVKILFKTNSSITEDFVNDMVRSNTDNLPGRTLFSTIHLFVENAT